VDIAKPLAIATILHLSLAVRKMTSPELRSATLALNERPLVVEVIKISVARG